MQQSAESYLKGLREDHARFSRVLSMIGRDARRLIDEPESVLPLFTEAVDYVVHFQNVYHHPREEVMFAKIAAKSESLATAASRLSVEHGATEKAGEALLSSIGSLSTGTDSRIDRAELARRLERFARSMRKHIAKEEEVLYAQAWAELTESDWEELAGHADTADPLASIVDVRYPLLADYVASGRTHSNVVMENSPLGAALESGMTQLVALGEQMRAARSTARRQRREACALTRKALQSMPIIPFLEPRKSLRAGIESAEAFGRAYARWITEWAEIYRPGTDIETRGS